MSCRPSWCQLHGGAAPGASSGSTSAATSPMSRSSRAAGLPGGCRDRRLDPRRRGRHRPLRAARQARVVPGSRSAGPPVGRPAGDARPHQPRGRGPCPGPAVRGGPLRGPLTGTAGRVPCPAQGAAGSRRRDRRHGPQARGAGLAPAHEGRGLPVRPGRAHAFKQRQLDRMAGRSGTRPSQRGATGSSRDRRPARLRGGHDPHDPALRQAIDRVHPDTTPPSGT